MVQMYVMTHKQFDLPVKDDAYIPLQVGRALKPELGYLTDNTGDNISAKNANYCELTGIYWIWKNVTADYVGICHYRRYFLNKRGVFASGKDMEEILKDYDVILPNASMADTSIYNHYCKVHFEKDLCCTRQIIEEMCPEYVSAFDFILNSNMMSMGNMVIAKKNIYDAYCAWLFPILFELEKRTDITDYTDYQKRLYGFISERLARVWYAKQTYRIYELEVKNIELTELDMEQRRR